MKRAVRVCLALAWAGAAALAWGQGSSPIGAADLASERQRIDAERRSIAARFAQQEQTCHQRFAVTDCLNRNLNWQRAALAELRRQEVLLNDNERQRRAAERLERLDDKAQERATDAASRPAAEPRLPNAPPRPGGGKLPQAGEPVPRAADPASIRAHEERMERKQERQAENAARRDELAAQAAEEARHHQARVQEAQERKARILERNAADPSTAQPLPVPALP